MRYTSNFLLTKKTDDDMGIDLPAAKHVVIKSGETKIVPTQTAIEFPLYGRFRRWLIKTIFGVEIRGIGGLLWPKSKHDFTVLAGVVDPGFRGEIDVKIHNNSWADIEFNRGEPVAQIVLVPSINVPLTPSIEIDQNTERGATGGIKNVR